MLRLISIASLCLVAASCLAAEPDVSVKLGERVARIGGCHDCHTPGFPQAEGVLDPAKALIGNPVGYNGPWGTTYAANLRIVAADRSEDQWVDFMKTIRTRPPMPWFNLHYLEENEARSLYQYIRSLGDVGKAAPAYVPPGEKPQTPFVVMIPQTAQ